MSGVIYNSSVCTQCKQSRTQHKSGRCGDCRKQVCKGGCGHVAVTTAQPYYCKACKKRAKAEGLDG